MTLILNLVKSYNIPATKEPLLYIFERPIIFGMGKMSAVPTPSDCPRELMPEVKETMIYRKHFVAGRTVYVVLCHGFFRIGCATTPSERLGYLKSQCPLPMELRDLVWCGPGKVNRRLVDFLRKKLKKHHSHGEWFRATEQALSQLDRLLKRRTALLTNLPHRKRHLTEGHRDLGLSARF